MRVQRYESHQWLVHCLTGTVQLRRYIERLAGNHSHAVPFLGR